MKSNRKMKEIEAVTSLAIVFGGFLFAMSALAVSTTIHYNAQKAVPVIVDSAQTVVPVTVLSEPIIVDPKEVECLAANIYHEARGETVEGQVAVGVVTLNRVEDGRWPDTVCDVVEQKALVIKKDDTGQVISEKYICQFGWNCDPNVSISTRSSSWQRSQRIASALMTGTEDYEELAGLYHNALYFHNAADSPKWRHSKTLIRQTGGHYFYTDG